MKMSEHKAYVAKFDEICDFLAHRRGGEDLDAAYDALRRKPVRIVKYLHQHVLDLCNKHGITIYAWCWSTAYCHALTDRNAIRIAWIRSRSTYAAALHEIGHFRGQHQDRDSTSAREHGAWEWARANALVWTPGMEKSARKAERWYVLHAFWIDQPVQLKHSAYHEAGHAVIARVLGLLGGSATIAANHLLKSYGSSESDLDATVVYWRWPISEGGDKKLALRSLSCAYRAKVMELMAGREAELECLGPRKNSCLGLDDGDRIDLADVDALMPKIYLNRKEWPRRQDRLRRMTRALVRRHRDEIECIARALLLNRTLSASAIDFLLPRIPAPAARCIEPARRERKPARPFEGGNQ